jgi:hypothetical protein
MNEALRFQLDRLACTRSLQVGHSVDGVDNKALVQTDGYGDIAL